MGALAGSDYKEFLQGKAVRHHHVGLDDEFDISDRLFPFQRDSVDFLLTAGRAAAFLDTGLGKTAIQLEWARIVAEDTRGAILILAPLAVAPQTVAEGRKFDIPVRIVHDQAGIRPGIQVTNYEKLEHFDPASLSGIVLDESSILKSFMGKTTRRLIEAFAATPYRLACTATPAPNDHTELGNHAEFLGVMPMADMLVRWFVHDTSNTKNWRLKRHAELTFWNWMASWSRSLSRPADLGYRDDGFELPALNIHHHMIKADISTDTDGLLFRIPEISASSIHREKRLTIDQRAAELAGCVMEEPDEQWIIWCETDYEADALKKAMPEAVEVRGSMSADLKVQRLEAFRTGQKRVLVTKPSIAGFGLNWQHCARVGFVGLSFSYEQFYQAVRRCWRFGQKRAVEVHIAMADTEKKIWDVIHRKAAGHDEMKEAMIVALKSAQEQTRRQEYLSGLDIEWPLWMESRL